MKRILSLIMLLMIVQAGSSATRTLDEMKIIAALALNRQNGSEQINGASSGDFKVMKETANYCLLSSNRAGTVVVAKDDSTEPVLGYSKTPCDLSNLPCGFKWWLDAIDGSLRSGKKPNRVPVPSGFPQNVNPLVNVTWGQGSPYNKLCPNGAKVGCVAVAMGQIMSVHRAPNIGNGSCSYSSGGQNISVNFGETTYDWNKISSGNTDEIAKLLFHCGVAVQTNYGSGVSTAYISDVKYGLINYFRYSDEAIYLYRANYSETNWFNMLFWNLVNGHPIAYRGADTDSYAASGHAFVIDGYNSSGEMHINWGWNGVLDGYYDLSSIDYPYQQSMVCDIEPSADQPIPDVYLTLDMGGDGVVKLLAERGLSYEYIIQTEDNWALDHVYFNGYDVTGEMNGNTYTSPTIEQSSTIKIEAHDTAPKPLKGDVNQDGEVTIADINVVINAILSGNFHGASDVNGDSEISIADVNIIINIILNSEPIQPPFTQGTVQIGADNYQQETDPICNWHMIRYQGHEMLIRKEDLKGMKKGDKITAISYVCNSNYAPGGQFNVRMKNVTVNEMPEVYDTSDLDKIMVGYSEPIYGSVQLPSYSSGSTVTFNLSTPFVYDGNNIVIDIRNSQLGSRYGWVCFASSKSSYRRVIGWWGASDENVTSFLSGIDVALYNLQTDDAYLYPNVTISWERGQRGQ